MPSSGFAERLPPSLSPRLRVLALEPNFQILFGESSGRISFDYVAKRLAGLLPWLDGEQAALSDRVRAYVTRQLETGTLSNLRGSDALLGPLELDDLPLDPLWVERLERWVSRFSIEQLKSASEDYRLRAEREGQYFESEFHNDFIPNWIPDGLERAQQIFAHRYLSHHNDHVKTHGIEPEELAALLRARATLAAFSGGPARRRPGKRVLPKTLRQLVSLLFP